VFYIPYKGSFRGRTDGALASGVKISGAVSNKKSNGYNAFDVIELSFLLKYRRGHS